MSVNFTLGEGCVSSFTNYPLKPWLTEWNGYETRQTPLLYVFVDLTVSMFNTTPNILILLTNKHIPLIYSLTINLPTENKGLCTVINLA